MFKTVLWIVLLAQSTFGTLTGTVTDPSGAVISGASIVIISRSTQVERALTSGEIGSYLAPNLNPGVYEITVEMPGFKKFVARNVELLARQIVRVDIKLEVGAASGEAVDVIASVPVITTDSATVADSKSGREINELALNFRATDNTSPLVVATLAPGVQKDRATSCIRHSTTRRVSSRTSIGTIPADGLSCRICPSSLPRSASPSAARRSWATKKPGCRKHFGSLTKTTSTHASGSRLGPLRTTPR